MSVKISVLCEDHTHDRYLIEPVLKAALAHLGKPRATIDVKSLPRDARSVSQLQARICSHLKRWGGPSDAVVFVADADGDDGRPGNGDRRAGLLRTVANCDHHRAKGIVVVAIQEAEVRALWGARSELPVTWDEVLSERDPKERFFEPLLDDLATPDQGRIALMKASLQAGWQSLRTGCTELEQLEIDLRRVLDL